MEMLL